MKYKVSQIEDYYKVTQVESYYKIRRIDSMGLWHAPSKDDLNKVYTNLHLSGLGGFSNVIYLSSSESSSTLIWGQDFTDGSQSTQVKSIESYVRPVRRFTAARGTFSLRDSAPGGGYIYYINEEEYYEAYPTDVSTGYYWSNVQSTAVGTTGTAIGTGVQNTLDIIAQSGHITSAASISHLINPGTFSDWFLFSFDEAKEAYDELKLYGLSDFKSFNYWTSMENIPQAATNAYALNFSNRQTSSVPKSDTWYVRACRTFRSTATYALRDIGPGGGYVFLIEGDRYYEENGADLSISKAYSNITNAAIGASAQGQGIGKGILNTAAIIGQAGHTDSAAKLCNDYSV